MYIPTFFLSLEFKIGESRWMGGDVPTMVNGEVRKVCHVIPGNAHDGHARKWRCNKNLEKHNCAPAVNCVRNWQSGDITVTVQSRALTLITYLIKSSIYTSIISPIDRGDNFWLTAKKKFDLAKSIVFWLTTMCFLSTIWYQSQPK